MENDYFDFNSPGVKERKPSTPARKKLNMDIYANEEFSKLAIQDKRYHLQNIDNFMSPVRNTSSGAFKRPECFDDSFCPSNSKRLRIENLIPISPSILNNNPQVERQYRVMKVLTSSSNILRKNRL